ncbi:oleosin 16.4 kDa-like [Pistacia vera]|nr:oleosin 16.4 kDa-like [Pistacia vera]
MADHRQTHQRHPHQQQYHPNEAFKGMLPERAPSKSQFLTLVTLLPVGGTLLLLSGLTLAGTLIGLAITTPLFVIFSPVLVPAALVIGLAITGFLTSGAFGITALSALSWMANSLRRMRVPEQMDHLKRLAQETAGQVGPKTREMAQTVQAKAQESGREAKDHKEGVKTGRERDSNKDNKE